jgi:hypothetical protein
MAMGDRDRAIAFLNQGVATAQDASKPTHGAHAYGLFCNSVMQDPTYGYAWYNLGNANHDIKHLQSAVAAWRVALNQDNDADTRAKILCNLSWDLNTLCEPHEALKYAQEAIKLDPRLTNAWINLSQISGALMDFSTAISAARKAHEMDPANNEAEVALAFALLHAGRYAEGFKHFERRFAWRLHHFLQYPFPKWNGESNKVVYIVADQGLGDTLSFARFVPAVAAKCRFVHMSVQPELMRLFSFAFASLSNVSIHPLAQQTVMQPADFWTTFVSLPYNLGLSDDEIANTGPLPVPTYPVNRAWKSTDRKLHIGIQYAGSSSNDIDRHRSIPVAQFLELYRVPGIQLYSLQIDERKSDLHNIGAAALMRDLSPYVRDVTDTMSILRDLDMVICCESALAHMAGMMGKECWIPYSFYGRDYRIGYKGRKVLWYPNHRIFYQEPGQNWTHVFRDVVRALRKRVGE